MIAVVKWYAEGRPPYPEGPCPLCATAIAAMRKAITDSVIAFMPLILQHYPENTA